MKSSAKQLKESRKTLFFDYSKKMRLITYIQTHHQISRRNFVSFIDDRAVLLNGKNVESYKQEIAPGDVIEIVAPNFKLKDTVKEEKKRSIIVLFNKPKGYVASKSDPHNKTIYDILPLEFKNYYYIWRLDKDSHWLLLLTDDPALVNDYEHPKHGIEKEYDIQLDNDLSPKDRIQAIQGVKDGEDTLKALKIFQIKRYHYRVLLNEGKKRHIRRLFQTLWYHVLDLQRIREGEFRLWDIKLWERKILK